MVRKKRRVKSKEREKAGGFPFLFFSFLVKHCFKEEKGKLQALHQFLALDNTRREIFKS
jgi:hypothetical protein